VRTLLPGGVAGASSGIPSASPRCRGRCACGVPGSCDCDCNCECDCDCDCAWAWGCDCDWELLQPRAFPASESQRWVSDILLLLLVVL